MPDNEDYEWLADRLANPFDWDEKDYSAVRFLARNQRDALASMHPLDRQRRASAEEAAAEMEAAMAQHEGQHHE